MNSLSTHLEHRQHQVLSPRLQHAVRLLQLSSLDFAQEVQAALGNNPFLEPEEPAGENPIALGELGEFGGIASAASGVAATPEPAQGAADHEADNEGDNGWEREGSELSAGRTHDGSGDAEGGIMEMVAADVGLRPHLRAQMNLLPLSPRDRVLVGSIIESLDDDGYLRLQLAELTTLVELEPPVEACEMATALKLVQSLEPNGVAARSVCECLLLQLPAIEDETERELAQRIISGHLERLAQRDVAGLAHRLDATPAAVEAACERIRRLDPRPGWRYGASDIRFITPDVIVRKVRGQWSATLNPAVVPRVRINRMYAELFQQHRNARHTDLAAHLQEARWTVRNVEQRFSTILTVAQAILRRQQHFLEYGPLAMNPLGLREIADEVGLHESTVSRATNNKYMATPAGVFELKYFFSRAMTTASGGACSATAIRGVIKEMIETEKPSDPLSDAEIARQLARQGLVVARRTVTKYRQMLKLAAAERRRRGHV